MIRRRTAALAALALVFPVIAPAASTSISDVPAGRYMIDKRQSTLIARVMHMGVSLYTVRFDNFDASFEYNPAHPEATRLTASVDPASLDVNADYGKQLAEDFLSVSKFPTATFVATSAQATGPSQGALTGDLTLMGVRKPVTFNVTLVGSGHEVLPLPAGQQAVGFEATTKLKRSDFGSTYLNNLIGDDVTLTIEAEFDRK